MITQLILNFAADLLATVVGALNFTIGVLDTAAAWLGASGPAGGQTAAVSGSTLTGLLDALWVVDPFIPRTAVFTAVLMMLGLGVAMFLIWLVRFIISLVTGGGGSVE